MEPLIKMAAALHRWLAQHNLPTEGVALHIEFPDARARYNAEACLKADALPETISDEMLRGGPTKIMGIALHFESAEEKRRRAARSPSNANSLLSER